ncbi:hypothetical protein PT7_0299 [Pusillimonas sp. T7-7]|nr:hypothetical protein PT7_0299 [Pusillimonas sp. T7-7]
MLVQDQTRRQAIGGGHRRVQKLLVPTETGRAVDLGPLPTFAVLADR